MTPWTAACQASLSSTITQSLFKLMSIESMMPSNHRILCCHLLLLPLTFPSTGVFSKESALCIRWPKYCCFSFSISPFIEYLGLISFKIDWFDLPAVQRIFKSLLQNHNLKVSILQHSAFFIDHLSHPLGFPHSSVSKESTHTAGDPGSIPGSGSSPEEENGNLFQYSCLENPMDRGAWQGPWGHKSWTQLSD